MPTVGVFAVVFDDAGRILCVQRNYSPFGWTTPGGLLEKGENPEDALRREVLEETGYTISVTGLVGVYAAPFKDDLVLGFVGGILAREAWAPNPEISQVGFFDKSQLPKPMKRNTRVRIEDASAGLRGVYRVFSDMAEHSGEG